VAEAQPSASTPREAQRRRPRPPLLSICIPQFNRTDFLVESLRSLETQSFRDFEVCIADDCSDDGGAPRLLAALQGSHFDFCYRRGDRNRRYDANLRAAIGLARGDLALLLGNDDCLANPSSLEWLAREVAPIEGLGVAHTNYADYATGAVARRVLRDEVIAGPVAAARHFRDFSFVSGILLRTESARSLATERWDGSEMYQMYLCCRMVSAGGRMARFERVLVRKDIQLPGQSVDSYRLRPRERPPLFLPISLPLLQVPALVFDAIRPNAGEAAAALAWHVARQVQLFTFPFWLVEYRKVQSFRYALGLWLGMRPGAVFRTLPLGARFASCVLLHVVVGLAALLVPTRLFYRLQGRLHWLAKRDSLGRAS
jgi:hypothetical protein